MSTSSRPRPTLHDVGTGARFALGLARLLRHRVSSAEAHAELRERLESREANFLAMVREGIYARESSPYQRLLALAGCEYGDVARLVEREGLEGTLGNLYRRGVYLTVDEFKGRCPVVRGSTRFELEPGDLADPRAAADVLIQTGGSRGAKTIVPIDLTTVREDATRLLLQMEARGGLRWDHARWGVPGSGALTWPIRHTLCGSRPARWFWLVDPTAPGLHPRYAWSARAVQWAALLAGAAVPRPQYVPWSDPLPIVTWIAEVLRAGRTPCLQSYVSMVVRVCQAADDTGVDLRGAQFIAMGEPMTSARLAAIHRVGAEANVEYAAVEAGTLGTGCLAPTAADDMHLLSGRYAIIHPAEDSTSALPPRALLVTSLLPRARLLLLNVSLGDFAEVERRSCGCPLDQLGLSTHLHMVRSFEKLTAGGMTFLDTDLAQVLEETLPARFGGGPTDYQLLDDESETGAPRVRLLVHPRLGQLDEPAVREVFLQAIGAGSGPERVMAHLWREAHLPVVERKEPFLAGAGKVQHVVHVRAGS